MTVKFVQAPTAPLLIYGAELKNALVQAILVRQMRAKDPGSTKRGLARLLRKGSNKKTPSFEGALASSNVLAFYATSSLRN